MTEFFASGRAADLILVILALELAWLLASRRMSRAAAIGLIGPGLLIVLALRGALVGASWPWIAVPLALSLPLHLMDLGRRMEPRRPS